MQTAGLIPSQWESRQPVMETEVPPLSPLSFPLTRVSLELEACQDPVGSWGPR